MEVGKRCPHCFVTVHLNWNGQTLGHDADAAYWSVEWATCAACGRLSIQIARYPGEDPTPGTPHAPDSRVVDLVWPRSAGRSPAPPEVPGTLATDFHEACLVLRDSPKASAALSRRCLQNLLVAKAGVKKRDLYDQIQEALDDGRLPTHLAEALDAVRAIGNFASHPIKSQSSGEVVEVEPGEAEWNLDTIEGLFDFYFVQPEILRKKRAALDAKLKDSGKPPLR